MQLFIRFPLPINFASLWAPYQSQKLTKTLLYTILKVFSFAWISKSLSTFLGGREHDSLVVSILDCQPNACGLKSPSGQTLVWRFLLYLCSLAAVCSTWRVSHPFHNSLSLLKIPNVAEYSQQMWQLSLIPPNSRLMWKGSKSGIFLADLERCNSSAKYLLFWEVAFHLPEMFLQSQEMTAHAIHWCKWPRKPWQRSCEECPEHHLSGSEIQFIQLLQYNSNNIQDNSKI